MSPLRCPGIGMSDGEVLEHLWSFLRRFGKMTKEMRPAHRVDVITHALLHYGYKTKKKLGMFKHYKVVFNSFVTVHFYCTCMLCSQFVSAQVEKSERYPCINRAIFESGNVSVCSRWAQY